jgi:hypothetical protein
MNTNPEDVPDKTFSELKEDCELEDVSVEEEQIESEMGDYKDASTILSGSVIFAKMFQDDVITFREFVEYTNYLEDWNRSLEDTPLI